MDLIVLLEASQPRGEYLGRLLLSRGLGNALFLLKLGEVILLGEVIDLGVLGDEVL